MRNAVSVIALIACIGTSIACGGDTVTSPSPFVSSSGTATVTFDGVIADASPLTTHSEAGVRVIAMSGDWSVWTGYGNPAPFIQFWAQPGTTVAGELQVAAAGSRFYFRSVDLYSSTTPIPYTISGLRHASTVFTLTDTVPNTFGRFRRIANLEPAAAIDALFITLTNSAAPCCRNPMGLDNIVLTTRPTTAPATFSLTGQVTDSVTGRGIAGAMVVIEDGPNAGSWMRTDPSGQYGFSALQQSGFTVSVSAANYASQSQGVTLTSNQTLSFELTPRPSPIPPSPMPPSGTHIAFNGLTTAAPATSYNESGFTVSTTSGEWVAVTTYGNPAPFIQFQAEGGTTVLGGIRITAAGSTFAFNSVDLYSSTTPIPYRITGLRGPTEVFVLTDTLPNTFGNFRRIVNPRATDRVDALLIVLTNAAAPCCRNPMGLDNVALSR